MRLVNLKNAAGDIVLSIPADRIICIEPFNAQSCDVIYEDVSCGRTHCTIDLPADTVADYITTGRWSSPESALVAAARQVVARWEGGNLAAAVRDLAEALRVGAR